MIFFGSCTPFRCGHSEQHDYGRGRKRNSARYSTYSSSSLTMSAATQRDVFIPPPQLTFTATFLADTWTTGNGRWRSPRSLDQREQIVSVSPWSESADLRTVKPVLAILTTILPNASDSPGKISHFFFITAGKPLVDEFRKVTVIA